MGNVAFQHFLVSFMKNLKKLNAQSECILDHNGIRGLDLLELNIAHNDKLKDKIKDIIVVNSIHTLFLI